MNNFNKEIFTSLDQNTPYTPYLLYDLDNWPGGPASQVPTIKLASSFPGLRWASKYG